MKLKKQLTKEEKKALKIEKKKLKREKLLRMNGCIVLSKKENSHGQHIVNRVGKNEHNQNQKIID